MKFVIDMGHSRTTATSVESCFAWCSLVHWAIFSGVSEELVVAVVDSEDITPLEGDMWKKLQEADQANNLIVVTFEFKGGFLSNTMISFQRAFKSATAWRVFLLSP